MAVTETYWSIVTNPPHIFAEITWDLILDVVGALVLYPIGRLLLRRHDRNNHNTER